MKNKLVYWLMIVYVVLLTSACAAGPGDGGGGGLPDNDTSQMEESSGDEIDKVLQGNYDFEMSAAVDGLVADMAYDQLTSDWWGELEVDADGLINGDGIVSYDALIFAVDEELCGFAWTELGDVEFKISGRVSEKDGEYYYPVKLLLMEPQIASTTDPEPTCEDPQSFLSKIPPQYLEIHRDALLMTVLTHLHQNIGNQIQLEETFTGQSGTVNYTILVSLGLEDLD